MEKDLEAVIRTIDKRIAELKHDIDSLERARAILVHELDDPAIAYLIVDQDNPTAEQQQFADDILDEIERNHPDYARLVGEALDEAFEGLEETFKDVFKQSGEA